jgi:hypothetical protein
MIHSALGQVRSGRKTGHAETGLQGSQAELLQADFSRTQTGLGCEQFGQTFDIVNRKRSSVRRSASSSAAP